MTPEDKKFVRAQATHNRLDIQRLLTLLVESEGMRMKVEYAITPCEHMSMSQCYHSRSDSDWIAAARKELLG